MFNGVCERYLTCGAVGCCPASEYPFLCYFSDLVLACDGSIVRWVRLVGVFTRMSEPKVQLSWASDEKVGELVVVVVVVCRALLQPNGT